jgi:hypothetical protein
LSIFFRWGKREELCKKRSLEKVRAWEKGGAIKREKADKKSIFA